MHYHTFLSSSLLLATTIAAPVDTLTKRADTCGQWDSLPIGKYNVYNNLWGVSSTDVGSQCIGLNSQKTDLISWHTTWSWTGSSSVKSYPNAVLQTPPIQLSSIKSIPSTWSWTYTGNSLSTNVAYDLFTSSTLTGSNEYEIMIWLAAIGDVGPISSSYGADGKPVPVATVKLEGFTWKVYKGSNGLNEVFSFLTEGKVEKFKGDVGVFLKWLVKEQGLSGSQWLVSVGAGTEPTRGSGASFNVSEYSIEVE